MSPQPEQQAREQIDALLAAAGWHVCDADKANIHAAQGVASVNSRFPSMQGVLSSLSTVQEVLRTNSRVLQQPAPYVHVSQLADSSVNITVRPWVHVPDYGDALGELNRAVLETFRTRGIAIPFLQREVHLVEKSGR